MIDVIIGFAVGLLVGFVAGIATMCVLLIVVDLPDFSELEDKNRGGR